MYLDTLSPWTGTVLKTEYLVHCFKQLSQAMSAALERELEN